MKKNISRLLQKGNLTPKERYILLIQNELEKAKTGKGFLKEADIQTLQNWQAKTNEETREWNRYNKSWMFCGRAGIEAGFVYTETKAEHYRENIIAKELIFYSFYRRALNALQAFKKIKVVDIKEAIEIINKANAGLVYADDDPEHKGENLDRELLITKKDKDGKPAFFSKFGMSLENLEHALKISSFKEVEKDGETYLEFMSKEMEKVFKETRQSIIDGYKKLLAFRDIFKRLSKTYKADLVFLINAEVEQVSEFIDQHNTLLGEAIKNSKDSVFSDNLKPLKIRDDLFIEKNKLQADIKTLNEWTTRFKEILGDDF